MSIDGFLVVDKSAGMTSHDVVAMARRALGTRKVGHAGTLDPMATGVLVLGFGNGAGSVIRRRGPSAAMVWACLRHVGQLNKSQLSQ